MLRNVAAALFAVCSIVVCAGSAFAAVRACGHLLGEMVITSCGKQGLVVGLIGMWGVVLFGFLLEQAWRVADRIAVPRPRRPRIPVGADPGVGRGRARRLGT